VAWLYTPIRAHPGLPVTRYCIINIGNYHGIKACSGPTYLYWVVLHFLYLTVFCSGVLALDLKIYLS